MSPIIPKSESWKMFNHISSRYDFLNRVLSLGQDCSWRRKLAAMIPQNSSIKLLDVATGTADVVIELVQSNKNITTAIGVDPAEGMLAIGQKKIEALGLGNRILLQTGDGQALPFIENTFDVLTISFGIRNIPDLRRGLLEMFRVLKSEGQILILEFSIPKQPLLRGGHWMYMNGVVPAVGFLLSGNWKAYQYLNQTVADFPYGERFMKILKQFGFVDVEATPLMGGVATIYSGRKP